MVDRISEDYRRKLAEIDMRITKLRRDRDALREARDTDVAAAETKKDAEEQIYRAALDAWEGQS